MKALSDAGRAASDTGLAFESYPPAVYNSQLAFDDKSPVEVLAELAPIVTELPLDSEFEVHNVEMAVQSKTGIHDAAVVE